MPELSLEDLKKQNEEEAKLLEQMPEKKEEEEEVLEAPEIEDPETGEAEDPEKEEQEEPDEQEAEESWMKGDEKPEKPGKFDDRDMAGLRKKMEGRLKAQKEESDAKDRRIAELEARLNSGSKQEEIKAPVREDYQDEAAYIDARVEYNTKLSEARKKSEQLAAEQKSAAERRLAQVQESVTAHYVRGAELAEKSGIPPEHFKNADLAVRQAVDSVFQGAGDAITDALIASIGEGSDKVFYNLGINKSRKQKLVDLLKDDPSGIKAATYLGELKGTLTRVAKQESGAPDPLPRTGGNKQPASLASRWLKEYRDAHKAGNAQRALDIKLKAKANKVDVSGW